MDVIVVLCAFPNLESAREIGAGLVEARLAACVSVCPAVESIYRWEGKVVSANEVLALIKTTRSGFEALERKLSALHPYEVPEIIGLPAERISEAYLRWVQDSVAGS